MWTFGSSCFRSFFFYSPPCWALVVVSFKLGAASRVRRGGSSGDHGQKSGTGGGSGERHDVGNVEFGAGLR